MAAELHKTSPEELFDRFAHAICNITALAFAGESVALEIAGITAPGGSLFGWQDSAAGVAMAGMAYVAYKAPDFLKARSQNQNSE